MSERDGKISDAQGTYDDLIELNPEPDPGKAREGLDAKSEAADEIINNPLNALDDENRLGPGATVTIEALTELIRNYGQGAKDVTDRTVTNADDTAEPPTIDTLIADIHDDFRGILWIEYVDDYGRGDRTSDEPDNVNYKGAKLIAYQTVYGQGDRTSNDETDENYKGTALIAFERVDGNGDRSIKVLSNDQDNPDYTVDNTDGEVLDKILDESKVVPKNYRGSAWIQFDDAAGTAVTGLTGVTVTKGLESFDIDANNILTCASADCTAAGDIVVEFTEDGSNNSVFNNAPDGTSNVQTESNAQRGLSFSVSYGDDSASSGIGFSTTDIVIDAGKRLDLWPGSRNHADRQ